MARVVLEHVTKRFGTVEAVKDANLVIEDKEFCILVGPSGCGKTTTLRMIAGLEEVTEGNIYIGDRLVNDVAPKDRDIAMVFQNYALYPHMTVFDNMAFGLKLRKVPKKEIEQKVKEVAEMLGIQDLLKRKPKELSGGQRQRVALGRAIVRTPQVFLMDEPLSNLDAKLRVQTRAELKRLHNRLQVTTIYVTHDQVEAMTMGDKIVVMNNGVIQQIDSPLNLFNKPRNLFVAGFIGSPAMNFINAVLEKKNGGYWLNAGSFEVKVPESLNSLVEPYATKEVIFGIRPQDIYDAELMREADTKPEWTIKATVDVTEPLGSEVNLYLTTGEHVIVATVDPATKAQTGLEWRVYFDMDKMHLFDPNTGEAII
ncbi:MAG: ABC transporter ATP-binding protein [bacterium]|jgi:multiple sugar transport system ATP-binding protein